MYHFFVEEGAVGETRIAIRGKDVNHIKNVLRMKAGEEILISSREGGDYLCRVEEVDPEQVTALILERQERTRELPARIHLYQGLPKSDKMEWIIQKAVELGAFRIIPVETARTVVRLDAKKAASRVERWNAISESAAKQSKRSLIPRVNGVMPFREALKEAAGCQLAVIPYENASGMEAVRRFLDSAAPGMEIAVFIGPEGGFEEAEIREALEAGVEPVSLGNRILRTETAGLCILSALMLRLEA